MDYLDPKKKRAHKYRLMIGYVLFAIAIGFATLLLVYLANGYYIDRSTGQIIQNGLVFIDSRPGGAEIYINGERQRGGTDARLVIPAGTYKFELKRDGYRPWSRSLNLEGGSLRRLTYARLIPGKLDQLSAVNLPAQPVRASQSIDKRWMILSYPDQLSQLSLLDLEQSAITVQTLALPDDIVTRVEGGVFEVEEWADDNSTFLLSYGTEDGPSQYVLVNRSNPAQARNLTTLFSSPDAEISMQDRKRDRFFVFNRQTRMLHRASLNDGLEDEPFVDNALIDYKVFGTDWMVYVVAAEEETMVNVRLKRSGEDILLKTMTKDESYMLEIAKLGNVPVLAVAAPVEDRITVYYDPEKYLAENSEARVPVATTVMRVKDPVDLTISSDSSAVMAYGSENFASHEFQADRSYTFKLDLPVDSAQEARWMDGQHFSFSSNGEQYMVDYDGSNIYRLLASVPVLGSIYSEDIERMYTFTPAVPASGSTPAIPSQLLVTSLLTEADR